MQLIVCIGAGRFGITEPTFMLTLNVLLKTLGDLQFDSWGWRDSFPYFGPFSVTPFQL